MLINNKLMLLWTFYIFSPVCKGRIKFITVNLTSMQLLQVEGTSFQQNTIFNMAVYTMYISTYVYMWCFDILHMWKETTNFFLPVRISITLPVMIFFHKINMIKSGIIEIRIWNNRRADQTICSIYKENTRVFQTPWIEYTFSKHWEQHWKKRN